MNLNELTHLNLGRSVARQSDNEIYAFIEKIRDHVETLSSLTAKGQEFDEESLEEIKMEAGYIVDSIEDFTGAS